MSVSETICASSDCPTAQFRWDAETAKPMPKFMFPPITSSPPVDVLLLHQKTTAFGWKPTSETTTVEAAAPVPVLNEPTLARTPGGGTLGETEADGETDGEGDGETETLGETEALGETEGEAEGEAEALGETDLLGETLGEALGEAAAMKYGGSGNLYLRNHQHRWMGFHLASFFSSVTKSRMML